MDIEKLKAKMDTDMAKAVEILAPAMIGEQVLALLASGEELSLSALVARLEAVVDGSDKADSQKASAALKQMRQHLPASGG